jgi:hypothetical protein
VTVPSSSNRNLYSGHRVPASEIRKSGTYVSWSSLTRPESFLNLSSTPLTFSIHGNNFIYYILLHRGLVEVMAVIQQMRHKCYSSLPQLHVFSSNKSACILPYDSLECYNNCKSSATWIAGWHGTFFHSFVSRIWWLATSKNKIHNLGLENFKTLISYKLCALLITLLHYSPSNTLVFADIIFKIIMNLCDRRPYKNTRNKQIITFKMYVNWQTKATFYCTKYISKWHLKIMTTTCFRFLL